MTFDRENRRPDDVEHLRQREADERVAADSAACMARTAHEDLADEYADRADAAERAIEDAGQDHARLLGQIDARDHA